MLCMFDHARRLVASALISCVSPVPEAEACLCDRLPMLCMSGHFTPRVDKPPVSQLCGSVLKREVSAAHASQILVTSLTSCILPQLL